MAVEDQDRKAKSERNNNETNMSIFDHLGELRRRLIYIILILVLGLIIGLVLAQPAYHFLMDREPANTLKLHTFSLWDGIGMYMKFAFVIALLITLPFTVFQFWAFVKPGLREQEQRSTLKYVPLALVMLLLGLSFSYFVVFPLAFDFTRMVAGQLNLEETFGITQYFLFLFNIVIPISLLFEIPLLIMFLTAIRILNPMRLRKMRRIAYFLMVFVGVVITPPDLVSDIIVAIPLILLYELSVLLSARIYKKQLEKDRLWEEEFDRGD